MNACVPNVLLGIIFFVLASATNGAYYFYVWSLINLNIGLVFAVIQIIRDSKS